ncbi:MAG: hypothetical protein K5891_08890, partial [Lachnospiraceae bacterium]|nr:hypothetical protein [Lachnospiraceae bacterium]
MRKDRFYRNAALGLILCMLAGSVQIPARAAEYVDPEEGVSAEDLLDEMLPEDGAEDAPESTEASADAERAALLA